jgi:hypothetical protein
MQHSIYQAFALILIFRNIQNDGRKRSTDLRVNVIDSCIGNKIVNGSNSCIGNKRITSVMLHLKLFGSYRMLVAILKVVLKMFSTSSKAKRYFALRHSVLTISRVTFQTYHDTVSNFRVTSEASIFGRVQRSSSFQLQDCRRCFREYGVHKDTMRPNCS